MAPLGLNHVSPSGMRLAQDCIRPDSTCGHFSLPNGQIRGIAMDQIWRLRVTENAFALSRSACSKQPSPQAGRFVCLPALRSEGGVP